MRSICSIVIVVVVACADRACQLCVSSVPYWVVRSGFVYLEYSYLNTPFRELCAGTPFKLGLIAKVGRVKSILPKNSEPPRVPPSYRCSSPFEVVPWAPFVLFALLLSSNNGYSPSPVLLSVHIFSPLPG